VLVRYQKDKNGKLVKQADIYRKEDHRLRLSAMNKEAVAICSKLRLAGHEAYIVGGALRDLLCGREPKDWDIVTDAHPARIKKVCGYARIIGKRFKLVHVVARSGIIFEVATFRGLNDTEKSIYGTLAEDAFRRDFTLNALYYDPHEETIIDFHSGYKHIQERVIHSVLPLDITFKEDPVRMLRAIKCEHITKSTLDPALKKAIKKCAPLLNSCSYSRLSEELLKILVLPERSAFLEECYDLKLLKVWMAAYSAFIFGLKKEQRLALWQTFEGSEHNKEMRRVQSLYDLLYPYAQKHAQFKEGEAEVVLQVLKKALMPVVLANKDLLAAIELMYKTEGVVWRVPKEFERRRHRFMGKEKT
jgi:poly(A) polymerase